MSPIFGRQGCPRRKPRELFADRGYDHDTYCRAAPHPQHHSGGSHGATLFTAPASADIAGPSNAASLGYVSERLPTRYERSADMPLVLLRLVCYRRLPVVGERAVEVRAVRSVDPADPASWDEPRYQRTPVSLRPSLFEQWGHGDLVEHHVWWGGGDPADQAGHLIGSQPVGGLVGLTRAGSILR